MLTLQQYVGVAVPHYFYGRQQHAPTCNDRTAPHLSDDALCSRFPCRTRQGTVSATTPRQDTCDADHPNLGPAHSSRCDPTPRTAATLSGSSVQLHDDSSRLAAHLWSATPAQNVTIATTPMIIATPPESHSSSDRSSTVHAHNAPTVGRTLRRCRRNRRRTCTDQHRRAVHRRRTIRQAD